MPSSTTHHESFDWGGRIAAQWIGVLGGPVAWATLLETNYVLSYVACEQRQSWMLHLATAVALALVAASAGVAWRAAPSLSYEAERAPSTDPVETSVIRARFMAIGGLAFCAFFAIVILATHIPVMVLKPCTP
jgi:tetrahydromethanopterin S-methyltransferase subunit E